jgi:hypothetical protein
MTIAANKAIQVVIQKVVSNQPRVFECSETMIESYNLHVREALAHIDSMIVCKITRFGAQKRRRTTSATRPRSLLWMVSGG